MFSDDGPPIRIAMDVTALLGSTTGVGQMVKQLASRLPRYPSLELTGIIVSWRGRSRLGHAIPPGWTMKPLPLPARLTHSGWRRFDRPRLSGYDVCRELKGDPRTAHIPIILLTAKGDVESKVEGLERGADAYMPKPFNPAELLARIEGLLRGRSNQSGRLHRARKRIRDHLESTGLDSEVLV